MSSLKVRLRSGKLVKWMDGESKGGKLRRKGIKVKIGVREEEDISGNITFCDEENI